MFERGSVSGCARKGNSPSALFLLLGRESSVLSPSLMGGSLQRPLWCRHLVPWEPGAAGNGCWALLLPFLAPSLGILPAGTRSSLLTACSWSSLSRVTVLSHCIGATGALRALRRAPGCGAARL